MKIRYALSACVVLFALHAAADYKEMRTLSAPIAGITHFSIVNPAGDIVVKTEDGREFVDVTAYIHVNDARRENAILHAKKNVQLSLETDDNTLALNVQPNDEAFRGSTFDRNARTGVRLEIVMPANLTLAIESGDGKIDVRNVDRNVDVTGSRGFVFLKNIGGNVRVTNEDGDIELRSIRGNVNVDDEKGAITLREIENDCVIKDTRGAINIAKVRGNVLIDGATGDVDIRKVRGDLSLPGAGLANVRISGVEGTISQKD